MADDITVKGLECITCFSNELVILGIHNGWLYAECLSCGENIKFDLETLDEKSYIPIKDSERPLLN